LWDCTRDRKKEIVIRWIKSIVQGKEKEFLELIKRIVCDLGDEGLKRRLNKYLDKVKEVVVTEMFT